MDRPTQISILAGGALVIAFYYFRMERVKRLKMNQQLSQTVSQQEMNSTRYPFVSAKDRINYPGDFKITQPGFAREGQYGTERREYKDPVGGTVIITHTDQYVNV